MPARASAGAGPTPAPVRRPAGGDGGLLVAGRNLKARLGGREVLSGVDIEVHRGEIVSLIGPNGAGKTTLLRVLLGLVRADEGSAWRRQGLRVGYVPQKLLIDPTLPLTVSRFLGLGRRVSGEGKAKALAEVGASGLARRAVQELSGGELQRVLLARALLRRPDLLALDEPVQGVDLSGQAELFQLFARIRDRLGCGIILVSHDLHLVMAATDRVICLNRHVCCAGHPEAVSRHPAYLELFGPVAPALAVYTHHHDHRHDAAGRVVHATPGEAATPQEPAVPGKGDG